MGTITVNNRQYELGWFSDLYIRMCINGAVLGASIGGAVGFSVAAVLPFVIVGGGARLLVKSVPHILNKLK
jgi:hypothetical protein